MLRSLLLRRDRSSKFRYLDMCVSNSTGNCIRADTQQDIATRMFSEIAAQWENTMRAPRVIDKVMFCSR